MKIKKIKKRSEIAEVSESTVKRALVNCPGVNHRTRRKILDIANELGFSSREVTADIGVVIASSPSFFWGRLVKALSSNLKARSLNYKFFRFTSTGRPTKAQSAIIARKKTVGHAKAFALVEMDNGSMINYSGCTSAGSLSKWYRIACETGTIESVRYDQSEYKLIECGVHDDPTITEHTWTSSGTLNDEEEAILNKSMSADSEHGGVPHGGVDFALLVHFLKFLRDEEQPFFDVYHAVSLSATGILAWYSMITDNRKFDIPDFRVKEERDKVRDDFRMPFAQRYDDLTLPCRYEEGFEI